MMKHHLSSSRVVAAPFVIVLLLLAPKDTSTRTGVSPLLVNGFHLGRTTNSRRTNLHLHRHFATSSSSTSASSSSSSSNSTTINAKKIPANNKDNGQQFLSDFFIGTNEFWKQFVVQPVRDYVEIRPAKVAPALSSGDADAHAGVDDDGDDGTNSGTTTKDETRWSWTLQNKWTAPPELPGIPRPVWFTIVGSVPTALGWYGYYKFCVEEELFQYELQNDKPVTGAGGYGTLFPFVYGVLIGYPLSFLPFEGSDWILQSAILWILLGQVNLYRRVNDLCMETIHDDDNNDDDNGTTNHELVETLNGEPPLYAWWALLPPPLDVVVGLRQVHFLSEYWRIQRGEPYEKDVVAEDLFPFISSPRFTLKEFVRTPSNWFWFTKDWNDFDFEFLKD